MSTDQNPVQHLVLEPGQEPKVLIEPLDYEGITAIVGYPIEVVNLVEGGSTMYVSESAKESGLEENSAATRLAKHTFREQGDYIAGTALVVGPLGPGGVDTSLTDIALAALLKRIEEVRA